MYITYLFKYGEIFLKKIAIQIIYKEASGCLLSTKLSARPCEEYKMNEQQLSCQGMQVSCLVQGQPSMGSQSQKWTNETHLEAKDP